MRTATVADLEERGDAVSLMMAMLIPAVKCKNPNSEKPQPLRK